MEYYLVESGPQSMCSNLTLSGNSKLRFLELSLFHAFTSIKSELFEVLHCEGVII